MSRAGRGGLLAGLMLYLIILGGGAHGRAVDASTWRKAPIEITTHYRFSSATLQVDAGLPQGTVIASAFIPEGSLVSQTSGVVQAGMWNGKRLTEGFVVVPTNLTGLMVRLVLEKAEMAEAGWGLRRGGSPLSSAMRGVIRIELVKTGPVQPGTVTQVLGGAEYRTYVGAPPRRRLALLEHLHYVGQLVIEVSGARPAPPGRRLS
ncbi:hypothetical protein J1780_03590 [Rahnella aceris]|uniref:hypothetical protein n=1 Tax=Rahnella sp. (strain Y9602) TaxID=2703885 RepID=UPI001C277C69|nr:hypothetical protein [Rahnella aceris]MBU9839038.1 hypothetical protein [Rahnella aceris]